MTFEHRNIGGLNRSLTGSFSSSNLLNPQDDVSFKLEYTHPYLDGVEDRSRNRIFKASCFNTKKLSPVFVAGPNMDDAPPIWVDRVGIKANITENLTKQSKFTYGLVLEEITTRDESNDVCTHGLRTTATGALGMDGPPTTFSGTGVDRMAFLQANVTRDNTEFVNGETIGDRCIFQVDQGLGIGSRNPFFNRHQLTVTKFVNLTSKRREPGSRRRPCSSPMAATQGAWGTCRATTRSRSEGLTRSGGLRHGRARRLQEPSRGRDGGAHPCPRDEEHARYAFAEHGTDLGSSKDVKGNPTEFFRRAGQGSSYGVGVRLGPLRAEYAVDHNAGTGSVFFRYGDRF